MWLPRALLLSLLLGLSPSRAEAPPGPQVLFDRESPYTRVVVVEDRGRRCLRFAGPAGDDQSCMDPSAPDRVVLEYVRDLSVLLAFAPPKPRVLMVGLGGGSVVHMLQPRVPGLDLHVVELDPVVIEATRLHFGVKEGPGLRITCADGRAFLEKATETWDVVLLDAYGEDNVPFTLTTVEFLRAVKARLRKGGVVVANLWTSNRPLFQAMLRTYAEVWPSLHVFPAVNDLNAIVVGTSDKKPRSQDAIMARAQELSRGIRFPFDLTSAPSRHVPGSSYAVATAPVLRDARPEVHQALSHR
jgi:spermidine synthase